MSKLIKTDCETFNLILKSAYVNKVGLERKTFLEMGFDEEED